MASLVEVAVVVPRFLAPLPRRDHRGLAGGLQGLDHALVGIEAFIAEYCVGLGLRQEVTSRSDCLAHRRWRGFWCSVRRASARSLGPRRLFLGAGAVLVGTHDGAVDHRVFVVRIGGEELKDPFPDPGLCPAAEAAMDVLPLAKAFRQIAPGDAGPVAVDNGFHKQAIIRRGHANPTVPAGQLVLDPIPLVIAQCVAAHRSAPKADRLGIEETSAPESAIFLPATISNQVWRAGLTQSVLN